MRRVWTAYPFEMYTGSRVARFSVSASVAIASLKNDEIVVRVPPSVWYA